MSPRNPQDAPRVSVALCTYNGARFVAEQIESILAQSHPVSEIVISDDGSTDDTLAIVERIAAEHTATAIRILPPNERSLGPTRNFERAIRACTGDVIALSDQDDVWMPRRIERCLARLEADPATMLVVSDAELVDSTLRPLGRTVLGTLAPEFRGIGTPPVDQLLRANAFPGMTFLFRRTLIERALPVPEHWLHDYWILLVALAGDALAVVDEPLVRYRQHDTNVVGVTEARGVALGRGALNRIRGFRSAAGREDDVDALRWRAAASNVERLDFATPDVAAQYRGKARFENARPRADASFAGRVRRVFTALVRGDYARYSRWGVKGAARDL